MLKIGTPKFQKLLYQMASKSHISQLARAGSGFPTLSHSHDLKQKMVIVDRSWNPPPIPHGKSEITPSPPIPKSMITEPVNSA